MGWSGIERNRLDYILTDLLPVELSELFSFTQFYSYLLADDQQKLLKNLIERLRVAKASKTNHRMFDRGWNTVPLKYRILKGTETMREMSVIQPLSALNVLFFIECYQKELLDFFEKNNKFSIRYHRKNSSLFYKARSKRLVSYFHQQSKKVGRGAIQQIGNYYSIGPFESINSFTDSRDWRMCNFKYRYYAQIDYKSCFDSIYSHAYKWIIERNVIDSKAAKNSHLFITIDRILQNINGQSSNGLIVGPEFSRMIAEVLLQQIDNEVSANLSKSSIVHNRDYAAFRYVDDIFLFTNEESALGQIIDQYRVVGENYLIQLNDQKIHCDKTPCLPKEWLKETRDIATSIGGIFFQGKRAEYEELPIERRFIVKEDFVFVDRIKDEISILVKRFSEDRRTIVSFLLSTFLNNIEKKSKNYVLFGGRSVKKALLIIDLILYTYAFYPSFEQTRKVISMISYINSEINFKSDADAKRKLSNIIERYSFVFHQGNLFDLCDWFPLLLEYEISLNATTENYIKKTVKGHNDPILWANLLLYSSYYPSFQNEISGEVEAVLERALLHLSETQAFLQNEFWFILVFHNCPFISRALIAKMEAVICKLQPIQSANTSANPPTTSETATQLVCSFLQLKSANGIKPKQSFFNWGGTRGFGGQITFRTYQRTLFKKYRRKSHGLYVSLS